MELLEDTRYKQEQLVLGQAFTETESFAVREWHKGIVLGHASSIVENESLRPKVFRISPDLFAVMNIVKIAEDDGVFLDEVAVKHDVFNGTVG